MQARWACVMIEDHGCESVCIANLLLFLLQIHPHGVQGGVHEMPRSIGTVHHDE